MKDYYILCRRKKCMKMGEKIKEKTKHITEVIEKALFPNVCPICNKVISSDEKICSHCIKKIKVIKEPKCKKCGSRLEDSTKLFCNDCNEICHEFEKGISIFEYNNEFKKSIYRFKYDNKRCYSDFYGSIGYRKYKETLEQWKIDKIIPVPMYYKKQIMRGYNQAEEFGNALSRYSGIKADSDILLRVKNTKPQKGLNKEQRKVNLAEAFAVNKEKIKNAENILLVDDVYTTGSTMDTLAKLLKKAGAGKVYFMCIATGKR